MPYICTNLRFAARSARHHDTRFVLAALVLALFALPTTGAKAQLSASPTAAAIPAASPLVVATGLGDDPPTPTEAVPIAGAAGPVIVRGGEAAEPIVNAVEEYRRTGEARTIQQSAYVAYPYGHSQPTLTCVPLRACVIELEAGEVVLGLVAGDTERWIIGQAFAGQGGDTPLVVVKPTDFDLTTNLLVSTDRRIYELTLDAPPSRTRSRGSQNPQEVYTRRIRFYYPDDMIRTFEAEAAASAEAARVAVEAQARIDRTAIPMGEAFRLENLNFDYDVRRSGGFPFEVEQVFDDGAHTYIKLPESAAHEAAPVLFVLDGGERALLNYAVREAGEGSLYYITDRVFEHGVLVVGRRKKDWLGRKRHSEETVLLVNLDR
jgi:type IV secretion system protein VirB9